MGMTKANRYNQSIKDKYADTNKGKQSMQMEEYIAKKTAHKEAYARIVNGEMTVQLNGVWLSKDDFNKLCPCPSIPTMAHDKTNCDKRKLWMFQ